MERLKKTAAFKNVYEKGKSYADKNLVVYVLKNDAGVNRFGVSVSKKVGNSVVRNRIRRLVKEVCRLKEKAAGEDKNFFDVVTVARKPAASADFNGIRQSVDLLFKKSSVMKKNKD